jgi:hypothetical protein
MTNVLRIGLNMDLQSQYSGQAYLQNYLDNPGFEQGMEGHVIVVGAKPSKNGFHDDNDWQEAAGFWNGANASVRTGVNAGKNFTIASFGAGGNYTCAGGCTSGLVAGDIVGVVISNPAIGYAGGHPGHLPGHWASTDGTATISTVEKEDGAASARIDVSDGGSHSLEFDGDTETGSVGVCANNMARLCSGDTNCADGSTCQLAPYYPMHPIAGPMAISFWALGSGIGAGAPSVTVSIARDRASWSRVDHSFPLNNDGSWHHYSFTFAGADRPADKGLWSFFLTASNGSAASGAAVYIDDIFFGPQTGGAGGFRNEVVTTLRTLKPGVLRYMAPSSLTQTDAYFEGSDFQKGAAADAGSSAGQPFGWQFSLSDMYALAGAVDAVPWVSIPDVFTDDDLSSFARNLCAAFTRYGFPRAYVEQSNEDWAAGPHTGGGKESSQFGDLAQRNFSIIDRYMTNHCPIAARTTYMIAGGQEGNVGVQQKVMARMPRDNPRFGTANATYVPSEPYEQQHGLTMAQYAALGFQASSGQWANIGGGGQNGSVPAGLATLCDGVRPCAQFMASYENGNGNQCGTARPVEAYSMSAGWVSAGFNGQNWILGLIAGLPVQNVFNLAQLEFTTANRSCASDHGTTAALWGIVHDFDSQFGPAFPHIRPIGLAMALVNRAIAGDYYPMDTAAYGGVRGAAFQAAGHWSAAISNSNGHTVALPIIFPGRAAPPTIAETVLYTHAMADNNENSNSVKIGALPGGITKAARTVLITLPPFSIVALEP